MVRMLSGQTEAISLVLISGIVVSLVGAAYFWGMPLIDKRAASTDFTSASNLITDINKKILSLANAGGGKAEIELSKAVTLVPADAPNDVNNNSLTTIYGVKQPILYPGAEGATLYLGATNFGDITESIGVFGHSSPGVITVKQAVTPEGNYFLSTKLWYRQLRTSGTQTKSYIIKLCGENDASCTVKATGTGKLILSFKGTETIPGNPDLVVTTIGVKLT